MVLRGRSTLSTLRDLMVLMSFPLLLPLHTSNICKHTKKDTHAQTHGVRRFKLKRHAQRPLEFQDGSGRPFLDGVESELTQSE